MGLEVLQAFITVHIFLLSFSGLIAVNALKALAQQIERTYDLKVKQDPWPPPPSKRRFFKDRLADERREEVNELFTISVVWGSAGLILDLGYLIIWDSMTVSLQGIVPWVMYVFVIIHIVFFLSVAVLARYVGHAVVGKL